MNEQTMRPTTATVMMPRDTNAMGNIFGGVILSHIDLAGAVAARTACNKAVLRVVTVAMDKVVFKKPVLVGDVLECYAEVVRVGKTSITTHIEVIADRNGRKIRVTEADAVYVAVNAKGRPVPVGCNDQPGSKKEDQPGSGSKAGSQSGKTAGSSIQSGRVAKGGCRKSGSR
jgi:acyl-CoA thioesterase YciA